MHITSLSSQPLHTFFIRYSLHPSKMIIVQNEFLRWNAWKPYSHGKNSVSKNTKTLAQRAPVNVAYKQIVLFLSLLILFALAACSSKSHANANPGTATSASPLNSSYDNALSINMQLVLGTFALDGTDNAVDAQQAAELLPLWKAAQSLSTSSTITTEEFQAIFNQIEDTMTPVQLNTIAAMQLTQQNVAEIAQKYALAFGAGNGGGFENLTTEQQAAAQAFEQSGQAPGDEGGIPGVDGAPDGIGVPGGIPGGSGTTTGSDSTLETQQTATVSGVGGLPTVFYDPIIRFLETEIQ